jgi:hypothetical protein
VFQFPEAIMAVMVALVVYQQLLELVYTEAEVAEAV